MRIPAAIVTSCIAIYFISLAGRGLSADFTNEDLMNLYFAWLQPISGLLKANLQFFTPPTRELGKLFYALTFRFAGLNPFAYHLICFLFLAANVYLTYCFARRIGGSRQVAAMACLLHAYHGSAAALYYNTGTCYDVFCFFSYFAAFVYYLRIRQAGGRPRPWQIALLACLHVAALNAKEMAVTLPIAIAVYEWLYHRGENWRSRSATVAVLAVITLAYIIGTTRGTESLTKIPGYFITPSAASYLRQTQSYLNDLVYSENFFSIGRSLALLIILLAIALWSRNRSLKFCWLFLTIGVLPIGFIPPRGLYAVYIPMVGLAIFIATLLMRMANLIPNDLARAALFAIAALALGAFHLRGGALNIKYITSDAHHVGDVIRQLKQMRPEVTKGSRILMLKDPFEGHFWDSTFLARLLYQDNAIDIDHGAEGHDVKDYDYVWTFEDGRLREK